MAKLAGSASNEIEAPLEQVWAVVEDVLSTPQWQRGLGTLRALERDAEGRPTLVETENDMKVRVIRARVRFSYEAPRCLRWRQEAGDMKSVEGSWELEDLGRGRTRATFTIDADLGRVLGVLVRGPMGVAARAMLNGRPGELKRRMDHRV